MNFGAKIRVLFLAALASVTVLDRASAGAAEPDGLKSGIAAYRAGDFMHAAKELEPFAADGHPAALRMTGVIMALGLADIAGRTGNVDLGVRRLISAARAGDTAALVRLEMLRANGAPGAPQVEEMVEIERHRAIDLNDAASAWRIAQRYLAAETRTVSPEEFISMLKIAASKRGWPKAADAAFALCETLINADANSNSAEDAEFWCDRASTHGHAGASLALIRFRTNDG